MTFDSGFLLTVLIGVSGTVILGSVIVFNLLRPDRAAAMRPTVPDTEPEPADEPSPNRPLIDESTVYDPSLATASPVGPYGTLYMNILITLVGAALLLVGGYTSITTNTTVQNARDSRDWPSVLGYVESASPEISGNGYRVALTYSYEVEGQVYENDRISFRSEEPIFLTIGRITEYMNDKGYIEGRRIRIYYPESDPAASVLESEHDAQPNFVLFGFVGGLVGAVIVGFGIANGSASVRELIRTARQKPTSLPPEEVVA